MPARQFKNGAAAAKLREKSRGTKGLRTRASKTKAKHFYYLHNERSSQVRICNIESASGVVPAMVPSRSKTESTCPPSPANPGRQSHAWTGSGKQSGLRVEIVVAFSEIASQTYFFLSPSALENNNIIPVWFEATRPRNVFGYLMLHFVSVLFRLSGFCPFSVPSLFMLLNKVLFS